MLEFVKKHRVALLNLSVFVLLFSFLLFQRRVNNQSKCLTEWCVFEFDGTEYQMDYPKDWFPIDSNAIKYSTPSNFSEFDFQTATFSDSSLNQRSIIFVYVIPMTQPTPEKVAEAATDVIENFGGEIQSTGTLFVSTEPFELNGQMLLSRRVEYRLGRRYRPICQEIYSTIEDAGVVFRFCPARILNEDMILSFESIE